MATKVPAHKCAMPSIVFDNTLARLHDAPTGAQRDAVATDDALHSAHALALSGVQRTAGGLPHGWQFVNRGEVGSGVVLCGTMGRRPWIAGEALLSTACRIDAHICSAMRACLICDASTSILHRMGSSPS